MKKAFNRFFWFFIIVQQGVGITRAQVPTPGIKNVSQSILVSLPDNSGSVNININDYPFGINIARMGFDSAFLTRTKYNSLFVIPENVDGRIIGLSRKSGTGNQSKFYILLDDGSIYLSEVIGATAISQPVLIGKNTLNHGSYQWGKFTGDDLYWLNAGYIDVSRDGGHTWQTDSAGLGGLPVYDLVVDAGQSAYTISSGGLYKQAPSSSQWHLTSFPNGSSPTSLFVDKSNRIFAGTSSLGIYYSTDTGHTWAHSANGLSGVGCGKFCQDVFGNIYMMNVTGSAIYRSADEGANWLRIDSAITNLEKDPNYTTTINDIVADSVLCVATRYGMFASTSQGNTWIPVNAGLPETSLNGFLKNSAGRLIETSNNGFFYRNPSDTVFTKILPPVGYAYAGRLFADSLGNIYTRINGLLPNTTQLILKSTDFGNSWQADTLGLWQITHQTAFGIDEYGYQHIADNVAANRTIIYNKIPGAGFLPDTNGIGTSFNPNSSVNEFASDGNGNIYMVGNISPGCWKRPNGGGNWSPDTAGLPAGTILQFLTRDVHHNMIANAVLPAPALYFRQGGTWGNIPFPVSLTGYVTISALAADNVNGIIVAFNSYTPGTNDIVGLGIYCTHNLGSAWHFVGFKGPVVYNLVTIGDTIYTLSNRGIYALTCNGVVNDPTVTGIDEVASTVTGQLRIFPNPASGLCHVQFDPVAGKSRLVVVDITGRQLKTFDATAATEITFSTSGLSSGIYFCVLRTEEKIIAVHKLVVQ